MAVFGYHTAWRSVATQSYRLKAEQHLAMKAIFKGRISVQVKPGVNTVCAYTNVYGFYDSQVLDLHATHCRPYKITNYLITNYFRYYVTVDVVVEFFLTHAQTGSFS